MPPPIENHAPGLRRAGPGELAAAMAATRCDLLRLFDAYEAALPPGLEVPYAPELNPPRWELGHVGWFEEYWLSRNPQRLRGTRADPDGARAAPLLTPADALYNSSRVPHARRWHLALPDAARTRHYLAQVRQRTLALLGQGPRDDDALYFFRLALFHEQMHLEAWACMAQHLALDVAPALGATQPAAADRAGELALGPARFALGAHAPGFMFDNELGAHAVELAPFAIDRTAVTWARFLPFVEDGGYDTEPLWSPEGWSWRQRTRRSHPRYLQLDEGHWRRATFGRWVPLDTAQPAVNLSLHEAQAWCRWAGRRLPGEAEWEYAAASAGAAFEWGQVWEWTASTFAPFPGFTPHPYRDYSQPWFDGRAVLRGASFATAAGMRDPRYRNFFTAERNDVFAGFRSCAA